MKRILNTKLKDMKAVTLIALVVTIVVLIILAGVLISLTLGDNGIFQRAKKAKEDYANAQGYEETEIAKTANEIDYILGTTRQTSDSNPIASLSDFTDISGETELKSYGLTYKTFPDELDDEDFHVIRCQKNLNLNLNSDFEISSQIFYDNTSNINEIGAVKIALYNNDDEKVFFDISDGYDNARSVTYYAKINRK